MHALAQGWLRSLDGQMKVVAHEHVGVNPPAEFLGTFKQSAHKCCSRAFAGKQIPPIVPPVDHMVQSTWKFDAQSSGHPLLHSQALQGSISKTNKTRPVPLAFFPRLSIRCFFR